MELRLSQNQQYSSEELLAMLNDTGVIEIDQKELAK
jgi:hypothetical protein